MESQKRVEKKYNKLLKELETNTFYSMDLTNRINCYVCDCGHITKTIDIDAGITPFIFTCEKCGEIARSTFYNDIVPDQEPTFEWYRPNLKETIKMRKKPDILEHVLSGGLHFRLINKK